MKNFLLSEYQQDFFAPHLDEAKDKQFKKVEPEKRVQKSSEASCRFVQKCIYSSLDPGLVQFLDSCPIYSFSLAPGGEGVDGRKKS